MPLSDEAFQRQVLADLATIKANQAKDEKSFDEYRVKVDQLISMQATNTQSLKDAHCRIDDVKSDLVAGEQHLQKDMLAGDNQLKEAIHNKEQHLREDMLTAEQHLREDITKEVSSIYRTAAIVGACVSFVISLLVSKWG